MIALLYACTGKGEGEAFDGNFVLTDANNYAYTSALAIGAQEVAVAQDFSIDWSALTTDLLGHTMEPAADVGEIYFLSFPALSHAEIEGKFSLDDVDQQDLGVTALDLSATGQTSVSISELKIPPNAPFVPEEYFVDTAASWLVRATDGATTNRMLTFVVPTEESTNHAVTLAPDSTTLDFAVDLHSLTAFTVPDHEGTTADWTALDTHANGNAIELDKLDQLLLARFDSLDADGLEAQFLDIELIADAMYVGDVYGMRSSALSVAVDADGQPFSTFGADSLWVLALRCTLCANPAPPFLTIIRTE